MHKKNIYYFFKLFIFCIISQTIHSTTNTTTDNGLTKNQIDAVAAAVFNPAISIPTTSINEKAAITLFGSNGLNIGEPLLTYIKKFYFYIEYITHIELAAKLLKLAKDNSITYFNQSLFSWNDLTKEVMNATGARSLNEFVTNLQQVKDPDWTNLQKALGFSLQNDLTNLYTGTSAPTIDFETLITTSFWNALPITTKNIINSDFWQNYLKFTINNTYLIDQSLIFSINLNQNLIFKYIPKIETGYYSQEFTSLRNQSELLRVSLMLNESYRNRLKKQSFDWSTTSGTDLYTNVQDFTNNSLFYTIATAATDPTKTNESPYNQYSPFNIDSQGVVTLKSQISLPSPYQEYTTCLAMIMILQKLTYTLFEPTVDDIDALTKTVKILNTSKEIPEPHFMVYEPEDYLPLEDLTSIIKLSLEGTSEVIPGQAVNDNNENISLQSLINNKIPNNAPHPNSNESIKIQGFLDVVDDIKNTLGTAGNATAATIKDVGDVIIDEAKVFYYSSGAAETFQGLTSEETNKLSQTARDAANCDWNNFIKDADTVLADIVQVGAVAGKDLIGPLVGLIDQAAESIGLPETSLETSFDDFINAAACVVTDALQTADDLFLTSAEGVVKISTDGIAMIVDVANALFTGQSIPEALNDGLKNILSDTITTLIEGVTLIYNDISQLVSDTLTLAASVIQFLTEALIDLLTFYTEIQSSVICSIAGVDQNCDPSTITKSVGSYLDNHKNTISQIVTTGLLTGATVATGGGALAVGIMAGFGAFAIIGGYQTDESAIDLRAEQTAFLDDYTTYIVNKEHIDAQQQEFISEELSQKFSAEINNRERSLGFYQNYLNDTLTGITKQLNNYVGSWQAALLKPDANNYVLADPGSMYGYTTDFTNLNIGQGFSTYSAPRGTITQEIAETPKNTIANPQTSNNTISDTKFWFNQRITTDLDQEANQLVVEIKFQTFYLLDNFYVGLYIGGSPLNKEKILNQNVGNLDQSHLAKMFVYAKETKSSPVSLGLYEFETEQPNKQTDWLAQNISGPNLSPGTWYHMKAELSGSNLNLKVWKDGDTEPNGKKITVTPCPQQTYGMIFSGAAGEFEVISPKANIQPTINPATNQAIRPPITTSTEKQREIIARKTMKRFEKPQNFEFFNLKPTNQYEIIKGNYLYTLTADSTSDIDDYVTTANFSLTGGIEGIGQPSNSATDALVSLITGKVYKNIKGVLEQSGWVRNISDIFTSKLNNLNDEVATIIDKALTTYAKTINTTQKFGNYSLKPYNIDLIKKHQYIYTPDNNGPPLLGADNSTQLQDSNGKLLYDNYFIFTLLKSDNSPDTSSYFAGMAYQDVKSLSDNTGQPLCILSLITGNTYIESQNAPITMGWIWSSYINSLSEDLNTIITSAYQNYETAFTAALTKKETQPLNDPTIEDPTNGGSGSSISGFGFSSFGSGSITTDESFTERQEDAGGDDLSFDI